MIPAKKYNAQYSMIGHYSNDVVVRVNRIKVQGSDNLSPS